MKAGCWKGQLLRRQQLLLKGALEDALALEDDADILRIKVSNCLALKDAQEAKRTVNQLITLYPHEESSWMEAMRVYTETRDQEGMRQLLPPHSGRKDRSDRGRTRTPEFPGRACTMKKKTYVFKLLLPAVVMVVFIGILIIEMIGIDIEERSSSIEFLESPVPQATQEDLAPTMSWLP